MIVRRSRIGAIVLAAGGSRRFGSSKQLMLYKGTPLVRRAVNAALAAGALRVVVVIGGESSAIEPLLAGDPKVITVINEKWSDGLATSLAAGLKRLSRTRCDGALVMLVDQPLVDSAALSRLIAAFDSSHRIVASEYHDTLGVPAIFARERFPELRRLTGDTGAGQWMRARLSEVTRVPLSQAGLDIDTNADAERLTATENDTAPS